ncbi:aldo/keto reductase [Megasphaera sueciensis]
MFLGGTLDYEESEEAMRHAFELGINFFDTVNCYSAGTSKESVGRVIKKI